MLDLGLGLGLSRPSLTASGGGGAYVAKAVNFDGATFLSNNSLSATENGLLAFSFWIEFLSPESTGFETVWAVDPANAYPSGDGFNNANSNYFFDTYTEDFSKGLVTHGNPLSFPKSVWLNVKGSSNTNFSAGNKIAQLYVGDTNVVTSIDDIFDAFFPAWNGVPFFIGTDDQSPLTGNVADFWFAPGQFIDFSIEANRRKFIGADGKPVDLGSDGSAPTGAAPTIFLSGDDAGFATNRGTGGAFTLTGALTNASTSPSD